tara:strand:+ start:5754 stop:7877 length:2124 start_codon:yes stop_codon:yes gene_type:complete
MATKKVNIDIVARDKTTKALSGVQKNLGNLKRSVFSLKGALIGIGAGAIVKSFVDVGREVESLQIRFKFLFGSAEEGAIAFDNLTKFASKVPFSLEEISRASGNLAVVADDANDLNRILKITGNVAAVTGLDFETTASQIQRAFSGGIGAADLFRERGVRALLGFKQGAVVTAEETVERFEELFSGTGQFAKATEDLSTTLTGTLSMLRDSYFNFQKDVAEGFFTELKKEFGDLQKFINQNEKQIEDIATTIGENFAGAITKTSEVIRDIAPAIKGIANSFGNMITGFQSLPSFVQEAGLVGALLFGKKGLIALGAITFLVGQIRSLIDEAKTVADLRLLDPKEIDNIEHINLLLESFKKQRADIIKVMNDPDSKIPLDTSLAELAEVDGAIANLKKRLQSIALNELVVQQMEEFDKAIGDGAKAVDELIIKIKKKPPVPEGFGDAEEKVDALKEVVGLLDNDFNDLFSTLAEKKAFNKLVQDGKKVEEQLTFMQQATKDFKDGFDKAMNKDTFDGFVKAGQDAFESLKTTLTDFVMTGKLNFENLARSIVKSLVEALIGKAISSAIAKSEAMMLMSTIRKAMRSVFEGALKTFASIPFPFNILAVGASIKFGMGLVNKIRGFEKGGRPPVGQPSIVGEKGAELFVPDQAGTIVPNNQLGMGQPVTVNFNINTVDARGFNELLVNSRGTIVNMINNAVNEKGKMAII